MKKLICVILFFSLLIVGCEKTENIGKGFKKIEKIDIVKFSYDKSRTSQSRTIEKTVALEKTEDIKKFIEIFNKKDKSLSKFDVKPMDFMVSIIKKDGAKEVYDLAFDETSIFFHQNGTGYFIRNSKTAKDLNDLMQLLGL